MDRFFSKLDLRDIKIDPTSTSFPPDADDDDAAESAPTGAVAEPDASPIADQPTASNGLGGRTPHVPTWSTGGPAAETRVNGWPMAEDVDRDPGAAVAEQELLGPGPSDDILKVSARSRPSAVAGAIAGVVREAGRAEVQAIGAGATNQAVKAVAIARDYLRETGIEAICLPAFIDVTIENEDRTAIRLVVEPR